MCKWYESQEVDSSPVLSARVRLARNLEKYPFPKKMTAAVSEQLIREISASLLEQGDFADDYTVLDLSQLDTTDKNVMAEQHLMSPMLIKNSLPSALILKGNADVSIMLVEEDHLRIQAFAPGEQIEKAWQMASETDDVIERFVDYAFERELGYLTSCPTNIGTGMRASFMVHLPMLESSNQISPLSQAIGKFGITMRGTHGEGSEAVGAVYQVSNQVTLGLSEEEIIANLKNITGQIIEKERTMCQQILSDNRLYMEDQIYRTYGILTHARKLSEKEALAYLSNIRLGYMTGILKKTRPCCTIYQIMMNIHNASLMKHYKHANVEDLPVLRANYIREQFEKNIELPD